MPLIRVAWKSAKIAWSPASNEVKAMASRALHEAIVTMVPSGKTVVVYGDSALVMGFSASANKPGKASLLMIMQ